MKPRTKKIIVSLMFASLAVSYCRQVDNFESEVSSNLTDNYSQTSDQGIKLTSNSLYDGSIVSSPIELDGAGTPNATLRIRLYDNSNALILQKETIIDDRGKFNDSLVYNEIAPGTTMTVKFLQNIRPINETEISYNLTQSKNVLISGIINQTSGTTASTNVIVWIHKAYSTSSQAYKAAIPYKIIQINASTGNLLSNTSFSEVLPEDNYHIRGFRDENNDGYQQINEPQFATYWAFNTMAGNISNLNYSLKIATNTDTITSKFLSARNLSSKPVTLGPDELGYDKGKCGGFFLSMNTNTAGNPNIGAIAVFHKETGNGYMLNNDGGCGNQPISNYNYSYDYDNTDTTFSAGIPSPTISNLGTYVYFIENNVDNFLDVQVASINELVKLPQEVTFTSPSFAQPLSNLVTPFSFNIIGDTSKITECYLKFTKKSSGATVNIPIYSGGSTNTFSFTPSGGDLIDASSYSIVLSCLYYKGHNTSNQVLSEVLHYKRNFITDTTGSNSIKFYGNIIDYTSKAGGYYISGTGDKTLPGIQNSNTFNYGTVSYELFVLKSGAIDKAFVKGLKDVTNTQLEETNIFVEYDELNGTVAINQNITFSNAVKVFSPIKLAQTSTTPTFSWYPWDKGSYTGVYSYVVIYQDEVLNPILSSSIWTIDSNSTGYTMSSNPTSSSFDAKYSISGLTSLSVITNINCSNSWQILVVACKFDDGTCLNDFFANLSSTDKLLSVTQKNYFCPQ